MPKYWDRSLADARMLLHALKGSGLAKMDTPYLGRCNTCQPPKIEEFTTEKAASHWADNHRILQGNDHVVRFAKKASVNKK